MRPLLKWMGNRTCQCGLTVRRRIMNEYRLITFCKRTNAFFSGEEGKATSLDVDFLGSDPKLAKLMDGWEPINFQLTRDGELTYMSVLLRINQVPEGLA